jgi:hypothetical protein
MPLDSPYIYVSGIADSDLLFNDTDTISIDLGIPDSFGQVWLRDVNATFGFNATPHSVDLTLVANNPIEISRNKIGEPCSLKIGAMRFYVKIGAMRFYGYVTHVDSQQDGGGYQTRVTCQDGRKMDLNKYLIHTEPLLDSTLSNVIVVPKELNTGGDLYTNKSPLWCMSNHGATYSELYYAINKFGIVTLPRPDVVTNRLGDPEAYRWSFSLTPLFEALSQVFDECGYDLYYYNNEIRLIDRSSSVEVAETFLDSKYHISNRGGYDQTDRPTKHTVLGAKKEGAVGTVSGVFQHYNLVGLGTNQLLPCWNDIEIRYHDNNGYLKKYKPTDDELKMALKSIDHWVYFKKLELEAADESFPRGWMESRIDPNAFGLEGSAVEAALAFGGGRTDVPKVIRNRRAIDHNWLVQWYDAVSKHARTYYGKLYCCTPSSDFLRKCMVIESAWVDDNIDGITLNDAYSPFYEHGKMKGLAVFPKSEVLGYGTDAFSVPVAYEEWNEKGDYVYIPISTTIYSPTDDTDTMFPGINETRMYVTLPEIVVSGVEDHWMLSSLDTLQWFEKQQGVSTGSGILEDSFQLYLTEKDINDPKMTIIPYSYLNSFLIPVQYNIRYGDDGSATTGSSDGNYTGEIDDKFAPWTRENPESPVTDMATKASALVNNDDIDRFLEVEVTGLPEVNFFANFSNDDHIPVYPFTSINVTIGSNGLTSRYNSKTQLFEFVRENKIVWSRFKSRLDRIQHYYNLSRLNTDIDLNFEPQEITAGGRRREPQNQGKAIYASTSTNEKPLEEVEEVEQKSFVKAVKIIDKVEIHTTDPNGGGTSVIQELYQSKDDEDNVWPPRWSTVDDYMSQYSTQKDPYATGSTSEAATTSIYTYHDGQWVWLEVADQDHPGRDRSAERKKGFAPCNDGYLRIGMTALYHQEDINGTVYCYFTGGIPLEDARLMRLTSDVTIEGDVAYADVETIPHPMDEDQSTYKFYKVPFASTKEVVGQDYATGTIVPVMHNKIVKGSSANDSVDAGAAGGGASDNDIGQLRPGSTHVVGTSPVGDLYIPNPPIIGALAVTVITPPDTTGSNGAVAVIGSEGVVYGANTEEAETVNFVGADPDTIYVGDYGIMTKGLNDEWYVMMIKPNFSPFSAFDS